MSLFPNPATSSVEIEVDKNSEQQLTIINSIGQQVHREMFVRSTSVDLHALPDGLYFVQCGNINKKLVVQH
jgi:hypothetical protein